MYFKINKSGTRSFLTLCDLMDCSLPSSSVYGTLQARYQSGQPFPSPGDLPDPRIEPKSPEFQARFLYYLSPQGRQIKRLKNKKALPKKVYAKIQEKGNKTKHISGFPGGPVVKNLSASEGDTSSIPGPGRFHVLRGS